MSNAALDAITRSCRSHKIDLPAAESQRIKNRSQEVIGLDASVAVMISAKSGHQ